jgi:hypothetical protein
MDAANLAGLGNKLQPGLVFTFLLNPVDCQFVLKEVSLSYVF